LIFQVFLVLQEAEYIREQLATIGLRGINVPGSHSLQAAASSAPKFARFCEVPRFQPAEAPLAMSPATKSISEEQEQGGKHTMHVVTVSAQSLSASKAESLACSCFVACNSLDRLASSRSFSAVRASILENNAAVASADCELPASWIHHKRSVEKGRLE
jgi:hypothetical protein